MGLLQRLPFWRNSKKSAVVKPFDTAPTKIDTEVLPESSLEVPLKQLNEVQRHSGEIYPVGGGSTATLIPVEIVTTPDGRLTPQLRLPESTPLPRSSSSSAEVEADDTVKFDVPLEEIYAGVSGAFSQMIAMSLRSNKWDKRLQALKAIATVLKGLDLQGMAPPGSTGVLGKGLRQHDRVNGWRVSCQLLNKCMHDKVTPVRLATLELFMETFANKDGLIHQDEVQFALNVLIEHVIDTLGDSNMRLHECARRSILFCVEHRGLFGLSSILERLHTRLVASASNGTGRAKGERAKMHFGIIDTVNLLLHHFPGRQADKHSDGNCEVEASHLSQNFWTQHGIAPFIIAGMDDSLGPRVRNSAVVLAMTVFQTFGMEAMKESVFVGLRPAKQTLLLKKFEDTSDVQDGDMFPDKFSMTERSLCSVDPGRFVIHDKIVKPPERFAQQAPMPGALSLEEEDDESFMDGILEEAGMVFNGADIDTPKGQFCKEFDAINASNAENHSIGDCGELEEDDEDRLLEEELASMGMNLEGLEEQRALFSSFRETDRRKDGESVEALLSSLVETDVRRDNDVSIEVF